MSAAVLRVVRDGEDTSDLIARFAARYPNQGTATHYAGILRRLERDTGMPAHQLHADDLIRWCATPGLANNSVRGRTSAIVAFLRWCNRNGTPAAEHSLLTDRDSPLRTFRPTFGKVQAKNPGRWLTKEQADRLIDVCRDGTHAGLRDEIVIRSGLATMRATEIARVKVGAVQLVTDPAAIIWTGKHSKPRRAEPGPSFVDVLMTWLALYEEHLGRGLRADDPLLCPSDRGRRDRRIAWGVPFSGEGKKAIFHIVTKRARQAGLGHVAPHDLKRTNAGILHRAKTPEGAHYFDLRDIQQVHGHADPSTTVRSYIEPMETDVIGRAGAMID